MSQEEAQFHWSEGNKFALEALKSILVINRTVAVGLIAFIGTQKPINTNLHVSVLSFLLGYISAMLALLTAYIANLRYANSHTKGAKSYDLWASGGQCSTRTYILGIGSIVFFGYGIVLTYIYTSNKSCNFTDFAIDPLIAQGGNFFNRSPRFDGEYSIHDTF